MLFSHLVYCTCLLQYFSHIFMKIRNIVVIVDIYHVVYISITCFIIAVKLAKLCLKHKNWRRGRLCLYDYFYFNKKKSFQTLYHRIFVDFTRS